LQGSGTLEVGALNFSHKPTPLPYSFDDSKILCLTNHYPSYDNIYCNGFVHARIKLYEQKGVKVSVFQFSKATQVQFSEFEGINVVSGNSDYLRFVLANNKYSTILVHFLDSEMWEVLKELPETTRIIVWCHGAEVLKYTRRLFNFEGMEIPANVIAQSDARGKFWSSLLKNLPKNIHFVFVSQWMKDIVDEDYSVKIPMEYYSIINNPINTEIFQYVKKDAEQRYHILSIRPYATRKYANDLSVKCILELSKRPDFKKFEITMIGDGKLFDDVLAPLRGYENVHILRTFLRQEEIYEYHKKNGIFLVPTRQDSQGVSKDEAMSSGLVPITNNVAAIPEFVDASCGVLSPAEDYKDMAQQIGRIVDDPKLFLSMSRAAAERVRRQTASDVIVEKELSLIKGAE
jgi:glycosyltransferase involved in cell wall biosynthesis